MSNINIKTLIFAALGTLLSLMVVLAAFGLYGVGHTEQQFKDVTLREARTQQMMVRIRLLMESNRSQILQALQHNPEFEWSKLHDHALEIHFATIKDNIDKLNESWKTYAAGIVVGEEKALADAWFDKSGHLGQTSVENAADAIRRGDWNGAELVLIQKINPTYRVGLAASDELKAYLEQRGVADDAAVAARIATVHYSLIGALLAAISVACLVGAMLVRNIITPLGEAVRIARRVADGDLSTPIQVTSTNELEVLLKALSDMNLSLSRVVGAVRTSADCIAAGAGEIAGGNIDLSQRTEEQASNLQQTASSMAQLSTTVESNADSARQAAAVAGAASEVAVHGGTVFGQVVTTMTDISTSSRKISDIIAVIDGIAFQTNILALNAAVEAARAGEQGRGFAVVASEVRSLAKRSADAAKEITALIHASVEKVESGTRHVNSAGDTMTDLVAQVKRVSALIGEISSATSEQTSGINEVGRAVHQLDRTTQQNAALVEHSAAAAQTLRDEAVQLVNAVASFKLKTA